MNTAIAIAVGIGLGTFALVLGGGLAMIILMYIIDKYNIG